MSFWPTVDSGQPITRAYAGVTLWVAVSKEFAPGEWFANTRQNPRLSRSQPSEVERGVPRPIHGASRIWSGRTRSPD